MYREPDLKIQMKEEKLFPKKRDHSIESRDLNGVLIKKLMKPK